MKRWRALALAGAVLCGVLAFVVAQRGGRPQPVSVPTPPSAIANSADVAPVVTPEPPRAEAPPNQVETPTLPTPAASAQRPLPQKTQAAAPRKGKDPIKDPLAREALAWVGFDEGAEAYWVDAINDSNLSAQERQDLIEDLNEDGISDPKRPTLADLPLILNRLDLIDLLAPAAMDQVNADAFMEAYKDLINLANVAVGGGEPVR